MSEPGDTPKPPASPARFGRRSFLIGGAGALAASSAACSSREGVGGDAADTAASTVPLEELTIPFDGKHQAGVSTPSQAHVALVAFNIRAGVDRAGVRRLLRLWTEDARALCAGKNPLGSLEPEMARTPANLTITCGLGARLFDICGLVEQRPVWLAPLPPFTKDQLDPHWAAGDVVLQICCDDPTTVAFVLRHMTRSGVDYVDTAWLQQGFLNAHGRGSKETPRNLFGQIDGTVNPMSEEEYNQQVWISDDSWLSGGSAMVVRRIAMNLDTWELLDRASREEALGRTLDTGAPLSGGSSESDLADISVTDEFGLPKIDPKSHMALSMPPEDHPEQKLRRRAYNYMEPPVPGSEQLSNAGLMFICFQKDPLAQFVPIQMRLDASDRLNEWITHIGSSVFAIVPGTTPDTYWAQSLLEAGDSGE